MSVALNGDALTIGSRIRWVRQNAKINIKKLCPGTSVYPPIILVSWSTEGARPQTNFCEKSRKSAGHPINGLKMVRMPQRGRRR